ncbi:cytochrome P450 [Streptomyces zhihengii]|uniref:cytochrome P450 n=1 Tax=Streptomyces zhihengii TaxID=1818004 RepID=UPI0033B070CD
MVWAGQHTTSRQLGRALITFAQHPEQWRLLASEPTLLPTAVNEILRWTPQARMIQRFAEEDVTYQGLDIAEGSPVFCCVASAGRDPLAMPEPAHFDLRAPRPAKQLVFGGGIHHCLGAALGRLEISEALTARFGPPVLSGTPTWPPLAVIHGPDSVPARFTPRSHP